MKIIITWITDQEACRIWAGPVVRFPVHPEDLAGAISGNAFLSKFKSPRPLRLERSGR